MKKLMAMLLMAAPLCASWWDCNGEWGADVELLYWTPCAPAFGWGQKDFGLQADQERDILILRPGYHLGWRLSAEYSTCCDMFIRVYYTWYKETASDSRRDALPLFVDGAGAGRFEVVRSEAEYRYQDVDLRAGWTLYNACCFQLQGFGDVRYIHIKQSQRVFGDVLPGLLSDRRTAVNKEFNGGSVGLGATAQYDVCAGFGLMAEGILLVGLGNQTVNARIVENGPNVVNQINRRDRFPSTSACIGGYAVKLGGNYEYCCGCVTLIGTLAYELNYYLNVLRVAATSSNTGTVSLGFHGLTAGVQVLF